MDSSNVENEVDVPDVASVALVDEQHPETTRREIYSWYVYDFANACYFFAVVDFVSVLIVDYAKLEAIKDWCLTEFGLTEGDFGFDACEESGWAVDFENQGTCVGAPSHTTNSSCVANDGTWNAKWIIEAGEVKLFGLTMNFQSTFTTTTTISIILQLVFMLGFGALADFGGYRKTLFTACNVVSALALGFTYLGQSPEMYQFLASMNIIANTFLNFALIMYNGWLPLLVNTHPKLLQAKETKVSKEDMFQIRNDVTAHLSKTGTAWGFVGVIVFLAMSVTLFLTVAPSISDEKTVLVISLIAAFWLMSFSLVTTFGMKPRPGPPIPEGKNVITVSFSRLGHTLRKLRKLSQAGIFLFAYFIYSDGLSTMAGASAVFAAQELNMAFDGLIIAYLESAICAAISSVLSVRIQQKYNIRPTRVLMFALFVLGLIPLYGLFGIYTQVEFFIVVAFFGFANGAAITFGRSIYSSMIPKGHESEFFSLYQWSDKGTSWLGPLILSIVSSKTGSFRNSFSTLVAFFFVGISVLFCFNHEKSDEQRRAFEQEELEKDSK